MLYGFAVPVLIVLGASLYVASALDALREATRASLESSEAIGLRYALLNSVLDAETGLRGYLLTSDEEFLEPYNDAFRDLPGVTARLEQTDAAEPEHIRKLHAVEQIFARWKQTVAEPEIRLRRGSPVDLVAECDRLAALLDGAATTEAWAVEAERVRDAVDDDVDARTARLQQLLDRLGAGERLTAPAGAELRRLVAGLREDDARISALVQSKQGKRMVDDIRALMQASFADEVAELRGTVDHATASTDRVRWIARVAPVAGVVLGLSVVLLLLLDAIRAIGATTKAAEAVAAGDLAKRVRVLRGDELGALAHSFNRMAGELAGRRRRDELLDRFQMLLVSSNSMDELFEVVARTCTELFPEAGGAIYRIAASRNQLTREARWNWPAEAGGDMFEPEGCRALRTGQPYFVSDASLELPCLHTQRLGVHASRSGCLPLAAQGEMLGILQLCRFDQEPAEVPTALRSTAVLVADQLAMAMANLQLREQLRQQSIRDPLTGLFNRRYLEETMERELARSARNGQPLVVVAVDVDHFKRFNDTHGHEAGDLVLVELARLLREGIRETDIACRYGGEEFVLLMPDSPLEVAAQRAEVLRERVRALRLRLGGSEAETVSVSMGLAAAPAHGASAADLLRHADSALYAAKAAGRDRVVVYAAGQRSDVARS